MMEVETNNVEMTETTIEQPVNDLLTDIEIAINLVKQLKPILDGSHPSVTSLVRKLLFS